MKTAAIALSLVAAITTLAASPALTAGQQDTKVQIQSGAWLLHGDFTAGNDRGRRPAVLLLNKANGDRRAYAALAAELRRRGVSSLRLDLRGHGESVNAGKFIPFDEANNAKIFVDEFSDVVAALRWLRTRRDVDSSRLAVVGASYSAEMAAEAARREGRFVRAYAMLSPGSLSEDSAKGIDPSRARWLVVRGGGERSPSVKAAAERVATYSKTGEVRVVDSDKHATDLLDAVPGLVPWLAYWLQQNLEK